jgi:hypothetical protein
MGRKRWRHKGGGDSISWKEGALLRSVQDAFRVRRKDRTPEVHEAGAFHGQRQEN